jgi:hypothetical protein
MSRDLYYISGTFVKQLNKGEKLKKLQAVPGIKINFNLKKAVFRA